MVPFQKPPLLLRCRNASAHWWSVEVMNLIHAGDAYASHVMTTERKTTCRPDSVIPWCHSTRSAYNVWALSLMTWQRWSDADKWLVIFTPSILSEFLREMPGSSGGSRTIFLLATLRYVVTIKLHRWQVDLCGQIYSQLVAVCIYCMYWPQLLCCLTWDS